MQVETVVASIGGQNHFRECPGSQSMFGTKRRAAAPSRASALAQQVRAAIAVTIPRISARMQGERRGGPTHSKLILSNFEPTKPARFVRCEHPLRLALNSGNATHLMMSRCHRSADDWIRFRRTQARVAIERRRRPRSSVALARRQRKDSWCRNCSRFLSCAPAGCC